MRHPSPYNLNHSVLAAAILLGVLRPTLRLAAEPALVPLAPPSTAAPAIVVNTSDDDSTAPLTVMTLSRAVAAAALDPRDNVIRFDAGAFGGTTPTIRLRSPIRWRSGGRGHDRIHGTLPGGEISIDASDCAEAAILIEGTTRLTIHNLTIAGSAPQLILCKDDGSIELQHVTITGSAGPGIAMFDSTDATLHACLLTGNRTHGIELRGRSRIKLSDTTLAGNGQSALAAFDDSTAEAGQCRASANGVWNLVLSGRSRVEWQGGSLARGRFAQADLSESARLILTDCTLEGGERFGLFATGRADVRLSRCTLTRHAGRGIELQEQASLHLNQVRVDSSDDYGLVLFGKSRVDAEGCTFAGNGAHGVSVRGQAGGEFRDCLFTANRYSGLGAPDAGDGGPVEVTRCRFEGNGMRPIYRGPLHLDPMVPTPLRIEGSTVHCQADPNARVELHIDGAGEARAYLRTVQADRHGGFEVDCRDVPPGRVMTACATVNHSTSEFNVVAGPASEPILSALLGQTGPLSDIGRHTRLDARIRRWPSGTRLVFHLPNAPSPAVERYARWFTRQVKNWTNDAVSAEVCLNRSVPNTRGAAVIDLRYLAADAPALKGRGGVTFLKWDSSGWFIRPIEVLLATAADPRETCPRVLAHEVAHTLGLCHASAGLLSRMQGTVPPRHPGLINDFSPTLTFYDVLALRILYDRRTPAGASLAQLVDLGMMPPPDDTELAQAGNTPEEPAFSPAAPPAPR
ncbi:MAG TPA: right-handed parallel beta-helix repeat-containing protein [Phycisphaerae bacterium]|nr:right-handed parallel beta-helix repeat-containing protein [Phycisphaerae bacterium]